MASKPPKLTKAAQRLLRHIRAEFVGHTAPTLLERILMNAAHKGASAYIQIANNTCKLQMLRHD